MAEVGPAGLVAAEVEVVGVVVAAAGREGERAEDLEAFEAPLITLPSSSPLSQRRDFQKRWLTLD
jgi:hypothetical protein